MKIYTKVSILFLCCFVLFGNDNDNRKKINWFLFFVSIINQSIFLSLSLLTSDFFSQFFIHSRLIYICFQFARIVICDLCCFLFYCRKIIFDNRKCKKKKKKKNQRFFEVMNSNGQQKTKPKCWTNFIVKIDINFTLLIDRLTDWLNDCLSNDDSKFFGYENILYICKIIT